MEQTEIKATGHIEVYQNPLLPTCTTTGLTEGKYCSVCNDVLSPRKTVKATGHLYDEGTVLVEATCLSKGVLTYKCTICENAKVESIPATAHSTKTVGKKSAKYFAKGHTGDKVCSICNVTISKGKAIAKLKLKTPTVKYTGGKKKITVKYTKVNGATGFQVKYKIGKKTVTKTYNSKKTVSKVIKKLKKGNYKVQVRSFVKQGKKTAYSSWTKAKTVKVK